MYLNQYVARILSCEIALTGSPASTETAFGLCCSEHPTRTAETATRTAEHGIPITQLKVSRALEIWTSQQEEKDGRLQISVAKVHLEGPPKISELIWTVIVHFILCIYCILCICLPHL